MGKIRSFFERIIFESDEETEEKQPVQEEEESRPEPVKVQPKEEKPREARKPEESKKVTSPVVDITEQKKKVVPPDITLPKEETVRKEFEEITLPKDEPVKVEEVVAEPAKQPEPLKAEPVKPVVKKEEKPKDVYRPSQVISPMFGVQNQEPADKKGKKKVKEEPKINLADTQSSGKSVLGTVFSPLYGAGDKSSNIPSDSISPEVANLTVDDIIGVQRKKTEKKPVDVKPPIKTSAVVRKEKAEPKKETKSPLEINDALPNLSVTPFGFSKEKQQKTKASIHEAWKSESSSSYTVKDITTSMKAIKEEEYENLSLFDVMEEED